MFNLVDDHHLLSFPTVIWKIFLEKCFCTSVRKQRMYAKVEYTE